MRKRKLLFSLLALGLGAFLGGSSMMAQANSWESVYTQEQTTADDWTVLSEGSTTGKTLGGTNTTTYYRLTKSLNFTNTNAGGSGLTIKGTVYLYLPWGVSITCVGHDAVGTTGAGAGIELTEGNKLYIIGGGTGCSVTATGGKAANGSNGANGDDIYTNDNNTFLPGSGGNGGNGGGGAGAGIGSRGGDGGAGGAGGPRNGSAGEETTQIGVDGNPGSDGSSAENMGEFYVDQTYGITVTATGGSTDAQVATGGARGKTGSQHPGSNVYLGSGGGGGGAGGFGGAAANIGTGGPGGGGGGGGAAGNVAWVVYSGTTNGYYHAGAKGGKGGKNADNTDSPDGASVELTNPKYADIQGRGLRSDASDYSDDAGWETNNKWHDGGAGGGTGNSYANGSTNTGTKEYTITFQPVKTNLEGKTGSSFNPRYVQYSPSSGTQLIFPKNKDGYAWALLTYGKDCKADGQATSVFATPTKLYFGGDYEDQALRTEVLNNVYGDLTFVEVAYMCKLKNTGDNSETITDFFYNEEIMSQKYPVAVRLMDRTLYQDNHWNTLCLPFDMTPSQINISILQGASIYEMNTTNTGYYADGQNVPLPQYKKDGPVLLLAFDQVNYQTNGLQAGKPYLVKWTNGSNFVDNTHDGNTKHEVEFYNVTVTRLAPDVVYGNGVSFQGTFSSSPTLTAGDKQYLMLGANDKLYYPSKNINVSACRGYFVIPALATSTAPEIVMDFDGDEMTTSIQTLDANGAKQDDNGAVYNLNGQRLSAPQKGLNIVNGKKVIIK